jgi:hypothetical protein
MQHMQTCCCARSQSVPDPLAVTTAAANAVARRHSGPIERVWCLTAVVLQHLDVSNLLGALAAATAVVPVVE